MGDGHHGWASAEVILFLRDCLLREEGEALKLLQGAGSHMLKRGRDLKVVDAPTSFGRISFGLEFDHESLCRLTFSSKFYYKLAPSLIEAYLPWKLNRVSPSSPHHLLGIEERESGVVVRFSPQFTTAVLQLES